MARRFRNPASFWFFKMLQKSSMTSIWLFVWISLAPILQGGLAYANEPNRGQAVQRLPSTETIPTWVQLVDFEANPQATQPVPFSFEFTEPDPAARPATDNRQRVMPPVLRGPGSNVQLSPTVRRVPGRKLAPTPKLPKAKPIQKPEVMPPPPEIIESPLPQKMQQSTVPPQHKITPEELPETREPQPALEEATPPVEKAPEETTQQRDEFEIPPIRPPAAISQPPIIEPEEVVQAIQHQVDIQQKQIDTLQRLMRATATRVLDNSKKTAAAGNSAITPEQFATIAAQQHQSANRDVQVAREFDNIRERLDTIQRHGLPLPATAREHFMPTRFNESPIAHYGQLSSNFEEFADANSDFTTPVYFGRFLALLNEKLLLDVNTVISDDDFELASAQLDWYATDNLTISTGRFFAPIGFFNERLQTAWVFKTVDVPLMFNQVLPNRLAINGVSARGAFYPGISPVKFEYAFFGGNGLALNEDSPGLSDFADLQAFASPYSDNNNDKAFGGRIGISWPELGMIAGISGMSNGAYDNAGNENLDLWGFDFSLHRGNWDYRFELIQVNQQAATGSIDRNGWYSQLAYRNQNSIHPFWSKFEFVTRIDSVDFDGIDLSQLDLLSIRREDQPVDRHRWTLQANYYVHPSLIVKAGYEILDEHGIDEISDNGFLAQVVFGF